ncbi:MAG: hypothetical protein ACK4GR_01970, partial [bacterium]
MLLLVLTLVSLQQACNFSNLLGLKSGGSSAAVVTVATEEVVEVEEVVVVINLLYKLCFLFFLTHSFRK